MMRGHRLKHEKGAVKDLIKKLNGFKISTKKAALPIIQTAITYFTNQKKRMKYHKYVDAQFPIGSDIIEAACKTITKQRLSNSGMRSFLRKGIHDEYNRLLWRSNEVIVNSKRIYCYTYDELYEKLRARQAILNTMKVLLI